MKFDDPHSLFSVKPTDFQKKVLDVVVASGFDTAVGYCPDGSAVRRREYCLRRGLYSILQNHIVAKANLTKAKRPRITLCLCWSVGKWSGERSVLQRFLEDMDVETSRKGWEFRLERHLKIMKEVAEDKETNNPKCPKCGSLMIEKEMKNSKIAFVEREKKPGILKTCIKEAKHPHYGEWFWGCLRFPKCRGMKAYWIPEGQDSDVGDVMKNVPCPTCGQPMVIRLARRGVNAGKKFLGCIQYPLCKGTITMEKALALVLMHR